MKKHWETSQFRVANKKNRQTTTRERTARTVYAEAKTPPPPPISCQYGRVRCHIQALYVSRSTLHDTAKHTHTSRPKTVNPSATRPNIATPSSTPPLPPLILLPLRRHETSRGLFGSQGGIPMLPQTSTLSPLH